METLEGKCHFCRYDRYLRPHLGAYACKDCETWVEDHNACLAEQCATKRRETSERG